MEREYVVKIECQFPLGLPEVVRCKDCKKRYRYGCPLVHVPPNTSYSANDEFFCGEGDRKDGDE